MGFAGDARRAVAAFAWPAASDVVIAPPNKGTLYLETAAFGHIAVPLGPGGDQSGDIVQKVIEKSLTTPKLSDLCVVALQDSTPTPAVSLRCRLNAGFIGDHIGIKSTPAFARKSAAASRSSSTRRRIADWLSGVPHRTQHRDETARGGARSTLSLVLGRSDVHPSERTATSATRRTNGDERQLLIRPHLGARRLSLDVRRGCGSL